jgi:hypothetical protein
VFQAKKIGSSFCYPFHARNQRFHSLFVHFCDSLWLNLFFHCAVSSGFLAFVQSLHPPSKRATLLNPSASRDFFTNPESSQEALEQ